MNKRKRHNVVMKGVMVWSWICVLFATHLGSAAASAKGQREIVGVAQGLWSGAFTPSGGDIVFTIPVLVMVYTLDGQFVADATSDVSGYFEITGLKPGTYSLTVTATVPPPLYFLRYIPVVQTVKVDKKNEVPLGFILYLAPPGPGG